MTFDRKSFDWKQAIFDQGQRVVRLETLMENHLEHHEKWLGWKMSLISIIAGGCVVWIFKDIFLKYLTK